MVQPLRPHEVIAQSVKTLRRRLGWSAERLAEELKKVGVPWERMVVTKLENNKRANISVEEMLALAYVLQVTPVHLMVPPDAEPSADYAVTPGEAPAGHKFMVEVVRDWIAGIAAVGEQDGRLVFSYRPATKPLDTDSMSRGQLTDELTRLERRRALLKAEESSLVDELVVVQQVLMRLDPPAATTQVLAGPEDGEFSYEENDRRLTAYIDRLEEERSSGIVALRMLNEQMANCAAEERDGLMDQYRELLDAARNLGSKIHFYVTARDGLRRRWQAADQPNEDGSDGER